jgi:hypothetical protein
MPTVLKPLRWHSFHLPKRGNSEEEYEDAFAGNAERGRFAVADGASESSFAGVWARLLAEGFVQAPRPWGATDWLAPLRERWAAEVGGRPLSWYGEMKRDDGAWATLLGLAFRRGPEGNRPGYWRALAVGDSCLVQLRGGRTLSAFPLTRSEDFGSNPALLASRDRAGKEPPWYHAKGEWQPGDQFLLMTDALAQWFLRQLERKDHPWELLRVLPASTQPHAAFARLIAEQRDRQAMRNDDVTLVMAESPGETPSPKE